MRGRASAIYGENGLKKLTNFRMYGSKILMHRNVYTAKSRVSVD